MKFELLDVGRRVSRAAVGLLVAAVGLLALAGPANATVGSSHVAVGSATIPVTPNGCPTDFRCVAASLSIDASDQAGKLGRATYQPAALSPSGSPWPSPNPVGISFSCVVISDFTGGHTLYAAGSGTDSRAYLVIVRATATSSAFGVETTYDGDPTARTGPCRAGGLTPVAAVGTFQISAVPGN